jgi:hypothetical protein
LLQRDFFIEFFFSLLLQEEARREKKRMEEEDSLEDLCFNGHLDTSLSVSLLER